MGEKSGKIVQWTIFFSAKRLWTVCAVLAVHLSAMPLPGADLGAQETQDHWFRVSFGEEWVGFFHETLSTQPGDPENLLSYLAEFSVLRGRDLGIAFENFGIHATCDAGYSLRSAGVTAHRGVEEVRFQSELKTDAPGPEWVRETATQRFRWPWDPGELLTTETLAGRVLALKGLEVGAVYDLSMLSFEVSELFTQARAAVVERTSFESPGGKVPSFAVELSFPGEIREPYQFLVDEGGRILQWKVGRVVIERAPTEKDAKMGQDFVWSVGGMRDPLKSVLTFQKKDAEQDRDKKRPIPRQEWERLVAQLQGILDRVRRIRAEETDPARRVELIQPEYDLALELATQSRRTWKLRPEHERILDEALREMAKDLEPADVIIRELKKILAQLEIDFEGENYPGVSAAADRISQLSADKRLKGTALEEQAAGIVRQAFQLKGRAETRARFKPPAISGIVYLEVPETRLLRQAVEVFGHRAEIATTLTLFKTASQAILDGRQKTEGESWTDEAKIAKILADGVIFEYHGEQIKVPFH